MTRIESRTVVPGSQSEIFAFLNLRESHLRFIPRMTELRQTSDGEFGQTGTKLSGMLRYFGLAIPVQYEIIEFEADRRLAMKGRMGPLHFRDGYVLSAQGSATEIGFWLELLPPAWAALLSPLMRPIGKIHAWETLRNLKRELAAWKRTSPGSQ